MRIINNYQVTLPRLSENTIDFANITTDESCGQMLVKFPLITDSQQFNSLVEFLHNQIREHYYNPENEIEQEFEESLNRDIDFIMAMNDYGNYEFLLFNGTNDYGIYTKVQVDLSNDEIELFTPYMYKYFEPQNNIEDIRHDICTSINAEIPVRKLKDLHLLVDDIDCNHYIAVWMSENKKKCMVCDVDDYTDNKCPVTVVKFGF